MRRTIRTLAATATTALLAAALATGQATAAAPAAPRPSLLVDCLHHGTVRPAGYTIACADGGNHLTGLTWPRWGRTVAAGTGVQHANDCIPACANGHIHTFPVAVTLSKPKRLPHHPGRTYFSRLRLDYGPQRPTPAGHATYPLTP